jgi:hypothetical protein
VLSFPPFASTLSVTSLARCASHMAAAAAAPRLHIALASRRTESSATRLLHSALVRFPSSAALSLCLAGGDARRRIGKWSGRGGVGEEQERGGGLVARLVAVVMDGVTGSAEVEVEQRGPGEAGVEEERCVKAVFFDLDDTLVLTHAADKVALQAILVSVRV